MSHGNGKAINHNDDKLDEIYQDHKFFGHPRGLGVLGFGNLFNSIAWASFNAVFIYYLYAPFAKGLGFTQGQAGSIISAMGVCNTLFLIVGSWLADRVLGMCWALIIGNIVKALGFVLLAVPTVGLDQGRLLMFLALLCLSMPIMGSSNTSLTAQLYRRTDDARRDAAFTMHNIFNSIGGLVAPVIVGNISMENYHIGFAIAAVAALLYGGCIWLFRNKFFGNLGRKPIKPVSKQVLYRMGTISLIVLVLGLLASYLIIKFNALSLNGLLNLLATMAFVIPILFFGKLFFNKTIPHGERKVFKPMRRLLAVQIFQAVIWAVTGPATLMYTDVKLDRTFMGFEFAPATFVSIGAAFALIFNPLFTFLWTATKMGKSIRSMSKMALSYILGSASLFVIPLSIVLSQGKVNPLWYIACLLVDNFTGAIGGPSGVSLMAKMAPKSFETQIQTAWTQCTTIGNGIGILFFNLFSDVNQQLNFFPVLGAGSILIGIYLRVIQKSMERQMVIDE
ncbi:MAG: oligopeptide:H+ symporter [Sporolactobacillus sp.]|jgi:POT family proton-dependent oligopeptide transporter|nr:oligopeptide:H+ symporter [Sporolactobacillus sp.]